ncbi:MAG TPA: UvrD-helicase domain-containing protein [Bryobacteraceae bacterium]
MTSSAGAVGDALARERIRESLDESLIVEASAGTGKTTELTNRIVRLLATGRAQVGSIVAVTFTNKAAGELKIRVRQGLDEARAKAADPVERANLEAALAHLEEAFIGTIHAFCAQILRQRPVEARVDPAFEEITEGEAGRLSDTAFDQWFQASLAASTPGLRRALARLAWPDGWDDETPIGKLRYAAKKILDWRDFDCAWRREMFARRAKIDELVTRIEEIAEFMKRARQGHDNLVESLKPIREFRVRTFQYLNEAQRDYDTIEALLVRLSRELERDKRKGSGMFAEGVSREQALQVREDLKAALNDFARRADADLAAVLRDEMQAIVTGYDRLKQRGGKLDFLDLLILVRNLVRDDKSVRVYLQKRYTHLFVDEFQDTDPLQAETLLLLSADDPAVDDWMNVTPVAGKLFLVGDPKQSIYKFRRADVTLYQAISESLTGRGVRLVRLSKSFRAVRPIQEFVNEAFRPLMTGDHASGQAEYSDLEEHAPADPTQPAVVALPVPRPYGMQRIAQTKIDLCLPDAIGAYVEWLIRESGWQVRDPEDPTRRVPIAARHIAILFRRFTNFGRDLTRDYVRSLEARSLPHLLVGSKSFHDREEVETLRAALTAIEWPDDELSVFATLRGSLLAIEDELLFRYRLETGRRLQPFSSVPDDLPPEFLPIRQGLDLLKQLHRGRNARPIADTVMALLEATRAHAGFALRPAGHQVLANVNRIADLARNFEFSGGISFRGFVDELSRQADKAQSSEAPVFEYAADGVRLMTVHNAKGLEFPIVILGDITAKLSPNDADRYIDTTRALCATRLLRCAPWELREHENEEILRERAEGVRVSYVAATRAKDLLVVPAVGDEPFNGWVGTLNEALYPPYPEWRKPTEDAPGCPAFRGDATVLDRPMHMISEMEGSVRPGLHGAVVWWDPLALNLKPPDAPGLKQEDILTPTQPAARESEAAHMRWQFERAAALDQGAAPTVEIVLASGGGERPPVEMAEPPRVERIAGIGDRPYGTRFGTLVHAILRQARTAEQIEHWGMTAGAQLQAPVDEIAAAIEAARAAFEHPLLLRSRLAKEVHREMPVTLRIDEQRVFEGIIDLAFVEGDGRWVIVDFKTTQDLDAHRDEYARQLEWYAYAVRQIRGGVAIESWILGL